ncbi:ATP-binding protein [Bowmanella denitrificans]|uniref:ATP-binding protein n=1 Tax=Bowmanella denitrificans TaxID=366582 RepID=UPI000C9CD250|nr:ATP-binding protein [Bowmanella denitrificans]
MTVDSEGSDEKRVAFNSGVKRLDVFKYFLPAALTVVAFITVLLTIYYESRLNEEVKDEVDQRLQQGIVLSANLVNEAIRQYRQELLFLHATPPISGLARATENNGVDPLDGTKLEQWKQRLSTIFTALMQNRIEIDQLRVISTERAGREVVRVDRVAGALLTTPTERLQTKSDSGYFKVLKDSHPGELYISNINLNREYGKIEYPYRPMLRLALPIFYDSGAQYGFLIINISAKELLTRLINSLDSEVVLMLLDDDGHFIYHPDERLQYSEDLNPELSLNSEYMLSTTDSGRRGSLVSREDAKAFQFIRKDIRISGSSDDGILQLLLAYPQANIQLMLMQERLSSYGFVFILSSILLTILLIFNGKLRSQIKLSETLAETEAIVNGASDAIFSIDLAGRIKTWNVAAQRLFGLSTANVLGAVYNSLPALNNKQLNEAIDKAINSSSVEVTETQFKTVTSQIDAKISLSPVITNDGTLKGFAVSIEDITAQKIAEQKSQLAKEELEKQVKQRTAELALAHQKAVQASEIKSAFISNVSHEMRTPLNGMMGSIQLLKRDALTDNQKKYLAMTESSTNTLATLINDILDLSKIEAGKLDIELASFNVVHMLETLAGSMAVKIQEQGLEFILDLADLHVDEVQSDILRLKQILTNLLSNASKFTEHGYIKLSAFNDVDENGKDRLHFEVQDSGVGIADENKHKMFQAFSQEHSGISEQYGGTGLGLSICRQLCHLLGGEIEFESQKGEGSCFRFYVVPEKPPILTHDVSAALNDKHVTILVGHPVLRKCTQRLLVKLGASATAPEDSSLLPQALEKSDICIFDHNYAELTEVVDMLAQEQLRCFALLGLFKDEEKALPVDYSILNKPLTQTELLEKVAGLASVTSNVQSTLERPQVTSNRSLLGHTILIVDDNAINVEVAKGLIEPLSVDILVANSGKEALHVLSEHPSVSCILMDCQMPILDGFETTQRIRAGEVGDKLVEIPIIAMTAGAMAGEREKCLASGMNDYLTKPISATILEDKLIKWCDGKKVPKKVPPRESSSLPVWDKNAALTRMQNNQTLFDKVVRMFIDYSGEKLQLLNSSIEKQDIDAVRKTAHAFRGLAGDVGASHLASELSELEDVAKRGDTSLFPPFLAKIQNSYSDLMKQLTDAADLPIG